MEHTGEAHASGPPTPEPARDEGDTAPAAAAHTARPPALLPRQARPDVPGSAIGAPAEPWVEPVPDHPGWRHLLADIAAATVVEEAETYANGWRRLTVTHGNPMTARDLTLVAKLHARVDQVARDAGHRHGGITIKRGHLTIWAWPSTRDCPAPRIVRAAHAVAEELDPGDWYIQADDH